jgi:hypothetical protein
VVSIALILQGLYQSRKEAAYPRNSAATLVVVPSHLIDQWESEIEKFSDGLKVICVYDLASLQKLRVKDVIDCDVVICPVDILESPGYLGHLLEVSGGGDADECPKLPPYTGQKELTAAAGIWIPATSADPYGGANNENNQKRRNASARYSYVYLSAIHNIRKQKFDNSQKGVPLEFFQWERIIVDEIHVSRPT